MALVLGTNCGFVTSAPVADPEGTSSVLSNYIATFKNTSPAGNSIITEIGWWCGTNPSSSATFEVGLYSADGAVVPGEAGTLLFSESSTTSGSYGWQVITGLNFEISSETIYHIAMQVDATGPTNHYIDVAASGGSGYDIITSKTELTNPAGGGELTDADGLISIYALYEAAAGGSGGQNMTPYVY